MAKLTKRQKAYTVKVDSLKTFGIADAFNMVKSCATAKFDESIDVAVQLGIDAKKSDQLVRGAVVMPSGTGKTVRVAVFTQGAKVEEAKAAGADIVGMEELAEMVKAGNMPFDVVIASPDAMRIVGTLGQILGPRGLMPTFGLGIKPRGPRIWPKVPTIRIASGEAMTTSKGILPALTISASSSIPTISAPAAFASSTLAPCVNTATRTVLPVPEGITTAPRTSWSDFLASIPSCTATSIDSSNFAVAQLLTILNASAIPKVLSESTLTV